MEYFDKLVHYQTCDFFNDIFIKTKSTGKISYSTFYNMCNNYSKKIISNVELNKHERAIISTLIDRLVVFFNLSDEEVVNYIYIFFSEEIWKKYYQSVTTINYVFSDSKNIYLNK